MSTQQKVTLTPVTWTDDASVGATAWVNPTNAASSNNVYSTCPIPGTNGVSHGLKGVACGFAIPSHAVIDGAEVRLERSTAGSITDLAHQLAYNGGVIGVGRSIVGGLWPVADAVYVYGDANDLWGTVLTPAIVNDPTFGVRFIVRSAGGASTANIDTASITIYYHIPDGDANTFVTIRGRSPFGAHMQLIPSSVAYAFKLKGKGTASFLLPRNDVNTARLHDMIYGMANTGDLVMITIERPDGQLPWVGWITEYDAPDKDPYITIHAEGPLMRFEEAITNDGETRGASGTFLRQQITQADQRSQPPLYCSVQGIADGIDIDHELKLDRLDDFVKECERQTDWEHAFYFGVSSQKVLIAFDWRNRQGKDRTVEEVWKEGQQFSRVSYNLKLKNGVGAVIALGGNSRDFGERVSVTLQRKGNRTTSNPERAGSNVFGAGGTRVVFLPTTTNARTLKSAAAADLQAPEYTVERLDIEIIESEVDMTRLGVGDLRRVSLGSINFNVVTERIIRITGIALNPTTRRHTVTCQVFPS